MAKREKSIKVDDTVTVAVTPSSRFTGPVERYLAEYERLVVERQVALEHEQFRDAFVLLLRIEELEDQLRSAFRRENFWSN